MNMNSFAHIKREPKTKMKKLKKKPRIRVLMNLKKIDKSMLNIEIMLEVFQIKRKTRIEAEKKNCRKKFIFCQFINMYTRVLNIDKQSMFKCADNGYMQIVNKKTNVFCFLSTFFRFACFFFALGLSDGGQNKWNMDIGKIAHKF